MTSATSTVMVVIAAQCCLGMLSSPGRLTDSCVLQKCPEKADNGFAAATKAAFNFMEAKITERIDDSKKVCQYTSYELRRVKDMMISGNVRGLYTVLDALDSIETSPTDGISRNIIKSAVTEVIDGFVDTFEEILDAYCNNHDSENKFQILDNIRERRNSLPSGTTTVVKSLFMRTRNNPAIQPGMEIVFNNTETKAIAICVRALDQIYVGSLMMFEAFLGPASESEDCLCKLYDALNISLKLFTRESNILCGIVKFYASIISEKSAESLVDIFSLIQMGQYMMLNNAQEGLKTQFGAMDLKLKSVYGILDNNTGCEYCKFDMAEEKSNSYFLAAFEAFLRVVSLLNKETASHAMVTRFSISDPVRKAVSYIFDVLRLSKSTSEFEVQNVYDSSRNSSFSQIKTMTEFLYMAIKNGQTYPVYMQALLNESQMNVATRALRELDDVYGGLKIVIDAQQGSANGYNDSQALIDRCRTDAYIEFLGQSEYMFNALRLLAVYTSTKDRRSTMLMSQIQMNELPTYTNISTAVDIIFDEILIALNNVNSGNYSSSNYSIASTTDVSHKIVTELMNGADITLNSFLSTNSGASWVVESARKGILFYVRSSIKAIFEARQLVQCQDCKGLYAEIEDLEKQATNNYTAASRMIFKVFANGQMNGTRVAAITEQYMRKTLEKSQNSYKNVFDAIRIVADQRSSSTKIPSNRSVILVNNIRSTCKTNVEARIALTYHAIQLLSAINLIGQSKISDGLSVIETQRQKAVAGVNDGFGVFYDMFRDNACSSNCSGTGMIDHAEDTMYMSFRILTDCAFYAMKTVLPETSSTIATVEGSTYAAAGSMASSLFSIMRSIQQNKVSGILEEIDIMQATVDCLGQAIIKSWYLPLIEFNQQHQQNNAEISPDLNNTMSASFDVNNHIIGSMFNEFKYYLAMMSPETYSESACSSNSIENQEIIVEYRTKSVIDFLFDNILLTYVTKIMNNAKSTAQSC